MARQGFRRSSDASATTTISDTTTPPAAGTSTVSGTTSAARSSSTTGTSVDTRQEVAYGTHPPYPAAGLAGAFLLGAGLLLARRRVP